MKSLNFWGGLGLALILGLSACDDPDGARGETVRAAQNLVRPGLGEDPGPPEVEPFALPDGVRLAGTIRGADDVSGECDPPGHGSGGSGALVRVCIPLENLTGSPVQIEFPPGLILVSTSEGRGQNGLLIERTLLTVPPTIRGGAGCRRPDEEERRRNEAAGEQDACAYIAQLNLYCLNEERDPSNPFITYAFTGVTRDRDVQALLKMLDDRVLGSDEDRGVVQNALWSITEQRGLTDPDRAALARLGGGGA